MIPATTDTLAQLADRTFRGAVSLGARGNDSRLGLVFDGGLVLEVRQANIYNEEESEQALRVVERKMAREKATIETLGNVVGPPREKRIKDFRARVDDLEVPDWLGGSTLAEEGELPEREAGKRARRVENLAGTVPDV
jgi:hypothetical protein